MRSFDIRSILDFNPPKYSCKACRGLFWEFEIINPHARWLDRRYRCEVCKSEYVRASGTDQSFTPHQYLRSEGYVINYGKDLLDHAKTLANLIRRAEGSTSAKPWPTMRLLFETLSNARHFVHFTSWGISHVLIGALKLTSVRVPVYGFVSNVEGHAKTELSEYPLEAPRMKVHVASSRESTFDAPHQKLVVVDGLVAFKGSTNLTNAGMRRADRGLDISEVVTDFYEVTALNNKYFAPVWKKLAFPDMDQVKIDDEPPF